MNRPDDCCITIRMTAKIGFLTTLSFFIFGVAAFAQGDWSVSGANYARYYLFKRVHPDSAVADSAATRFQFDFSMGDFFAGAWFELKHYGSAANNLDLDSITQRYFGWRDNGLEISAGNFYQTFDRGLILNAYRDENVRIDIPLDGGRISGRYPWIDFDLLSAVGRTPSAYRPTLRGARAKFKPLSYFQVGGAYVRVIENDMIFGDLRSNLTQANARINRRFLDLVDVDYYIEHARRDGYFIDYLSFPSEIKNRNGSGTYSNITCSAWKVSTFFEYKNYKYLSFPNELDIQANFNQPPAVNHQERSLQSQYSVSGEFGWRAGLNFAKDYYWGFLVDIAEAKSRDQRDVFMNEKYFEIRGAYYRENQFVVSIDRLGHSQKNEISPKLEMTYEIDDVNSVVLTAYYIKYELREDEGDSTDYTEKFLNLEIVRGQWLNFTLGGSWSDKVYGDMADKDPSEMFFAELTIKLPNNDLSLFYGGQRGGYVCSGGVCTIKPTFRGLRATLLSRF